MKIKLYFLYILIILVNLSACTKGKDCQQLYQKIISFDNRTNRSLTLEFVDQGSETFTVQMAAMESTNQKIVKEYYQTHEGGFQKGGAPYDASCTSQPEVIATSSYLSSNSFGSVKNCWDNTNYTSIIVEISDLCPAGTFEQTHTGRP